MAHSNLRMMAVFTCLVCVLPAGDLAAKGPVSDAKAIEGLWEGSWGGGERADGTVFQPMIAELFIRGDHVEIAGFRDLRKLSGSFRLDTLAKQIHITPAAEKGSQPARKVIDYSYELKADSLTLTGSDKFSIRVQRQRVVESPAANLHVEFVAASGINDKGDLLVTEFTVIKAGQEGVAYFQPAARSLKTKDSTVLLVQATGLKSISVSDARGLIRDSTPVVVAYRHEEPSNSPFSRELWKDLGPPRPDGKAASRTLLRILRPGTLVFILSAKDNAPAP